VLLLHGFDENHTTPGLMFSYMNQKKERRKEGREGRRKEGRKEVSLCLVRSRGKLFKLRSNV
jgi:hypothetical protein